MHHYALRMMQKLEGKEWLSYHQINQKGFGDWRAPRALALLFAQGRIGIRVVSCSACHTSNDLSGLQKSGFDICKPELFEYDFSKQGPIIRIKWLKSNGLHTAPIPITVR